MLPYYYCFDNKHANSYYIAALELLLLPRNETRGFLATANILEKLVNTRSAQENCAPIYAWI